MTGDSSVQQSSETGDLPVFHDVEMAAERIRNEAVVTPLLRANLLDVMTGARIFVKPENLQRTGSFKFRGGFNALSALSPEEQAAGVVACSSGNHAQGVAEAARILGIKATIVMPEDAPALKVENTRRSGAEIVFYDRVKEDRDEVTAALHEESGAALVHPCDNRDVIAGQGTCGLEIMTQMRTFDTRPDRILVCTGGGGLTAGIALAAHHFHPGAHIHCVEPKGFDDYRRSLEAGERLANVSNSGSACDALMAPQPGKLSFAVNAANEVSGLTVSDEQAFDAMRFAFRELKMVVEPGGAVALAALLSAGRKWQGEAIACVLSGGNVDSNLFARVLAGAE